MLFIITILLITLVSAATQKTFAEVYQATMKDNNGRVTYDGESAVAVLFYFEKDQNETLPSFGHPFIVPNDEMTKLKINNFYSLLQRMEEGNMTYTPRIKEEFDSSDDSGEDKTEDTNGNTETNPNENQGTNPNENQGTKRDTNEQKVATELYCRILVNYRYSKPIKVAQIIDDPNDPAHKIAIFPKFISVRTELDDDSRVKSVEWDHDECATCDKKKENECFDNFCTFTDIHFGESSCAEAQKKDKSACGLIIYFGWKGPAHAGFTTQYLKSYRNLPTHYTKYSLNNQFINSAADIEGNWFRM